MKPYYEHAGITIYHGDCREVLPEVPMCDTMITDPPYGISLNTDSSRFSGPNGHIGVNGNGIGSGHGMPVRGDNEPFDPRFLLNHASQHVIWGWHCFPDKLPRGACLVWLKRYDDAFGSFLSDAELAWMSKGHGVYCKRDLSLNAIANERSHPCQKPESLMRWCLSFFPLSESVTDPYMGSGTVLKVCKDLGRRAIGIEIEERYCEIAAKRLSQEVFEFA